MWIYSPERGLFNLDYVDRISADDGGTYLSMNGTTILVCHYNALDNICGAIMSDSRYVEV